MNLLANMTLHHFISLSTLELLPFKFRPRKAPKPVSSGPDQSVPQYWSHLRLQTVLPHGSSQTLW